MNSLTASNPFKGDCRSASSVFGYLCTDCVGGYLLSLKLNRTDDELATLFQR
ncbi:hypothetical protein O9992_25770 [Vibrio lentus]|nr:hypothetical protein [Vibrio lentus]